MGDHRGFTTQNLGLTVEFRQSCSLDTTWTTNLSKARNAVRHSPLLIDSQPAEILNMWIRKSATPERGAFFGFSYEVDAASGASGDWHRDADGDDGDASAGCDMKKAGQSRPALMNVSSS